MRKLWLLLAVLGCANDNNYMPTEPPITIRRVDSTPPAPYRHPSFIRNTAWNEGNTGMTLVYESEPGAKPWSFNEVTDTLEAIRAGWKAQKFEVRPGDCYANDCTRTPVYERNEFAQAGGENLEGDEYWYAWSFYVPTNVNQAAWVYYGQFQQHSNYDSIWMFMKRDGQPFCAMFDLTKNRMYNRWNCYGQQTYPLIDEVDFAGRWHDIVVHAKWTQQNNGFTRIYVDGELKVDYTGYTRTIGNTDVYFKYGIYRIASQTTSIAYFDEIRRGKTREEVDIRYLLSK